MSSSSFRNRGFTLLEISLALAVVGVTFAAVITLYIQSTSDAHATEFVAYHTVLETSVKTAWPNNDYVGLDSDTAADLFASTASLVQAGELRGPRGVPVTVAPRTLAGAGTNRHFEIAYQDIPAAACTSLVMGVTARAEVAEVGGTAVFQRGQSIDPQSITEACSAAGADLAIVPVN